MSKDLVRKYLVRIVVAMLLIAVLVTSVIAGGGQFSATFKIGSLIANGYAWGYGNTNVFLNLAGTASPVIACYPPGNRSNPAPGQNPPLIISTTQIGLAPTTQNGRTAYTDEAPDPNYSTLTPSELGCPNDNWTAKVLYTNWSHVHMSLTSDQAGNNVLAFHDWNCTTYAPVPPSTKATISCTQID